MPNVGPMEILLLVGLALLLFGPKRLPEIGSKLGKGMREFKESVAGVKDDFNSELEPFVAPEDEESILVDHDVVEHDRT
jgi:sec-independent protein translocase protein TatA